LEPWELAETQRPTCPTLRDAAREGWATRQPFHSLGIVLGLPIMTPQAVMYTVALGLLTCFVFWLLIPALDRIRDKWRERMASVPLTPGTEAAMLKQLRMHQASLRRLEQFHSNPIDRVLYIVELLGAALFLSILAVYLYPFRFETHSACVYAAASSVILFLFAIIGAHNMTESKIVASLVSLAKTIEELRGKLKVPN
jgi:hypothetical protein